MAFFDKLGETLTNKGKDVAKKAKDFAEINSLNSQISTQQSMIQATYAEIGKNYYEAHRVDAGDPYADKMQVIDNALAQIAALNAQIRQVKGIKICANCGAEVPAESAFCSACGARVTEETPVQEEEPASAGIHCPNCGAELPADAAFCTSCGQKLN